MISIAFICLLGLSAAGLTGIAARESYTQSSIERTRSIAEALPSTEISALSGKKSDLTKNEYKLTKDRLSRVKSANNDIQLIHITQLHDNTIVYAVDSEKFASGKYTQPGTVYLGNNIGLYQAFLGQNTYFEGPYSSMNGYQMTSAAPIYDSKTGAFIGMLGIDSPASQFFIDIATRMMIPILIALTASLLLWKIDQTRRKHEEILTLKNQFVSIASHELRSPLSGMLWAVQSLLQDKSTSKHQAEILTDMFKSTESSITTVNEILDLSAFDQSRVAPKQRVEMDLNAAAREVLKNLKLSAAEKHITLDARHLDEPASILGDPSVIKRSLTNLIANAIKYSPAKSTVRVIYRKQGHNHQITVSDKGIGIPKRDQKRVLNGYFRAKNAVKMQSSGTGIGLYVTKLIIEQHKGKLTLTSVENHGTSITVQLPDHTATNAKKAT